MSDDTEVQYCSRFTPSDVKMMTQARVFLRGEPASAVELHRGMILASVEGVEAGRLAGVAVNQSRQALCLILSHLPQEGKYQSLPVSWIERVEGEVIRLNARFDRVRDLPNWHAA